MKRVYFSLLVFYCAVFGASAAEPAARILGATPSAEFGTEVLRASDITLTQAADTLRLDWGKTEAALTLGYGTLAIDYAPVAFDFLGSARGRRETALSAQVALRHHAGPRLELLAGAGARDGFDSYRALWLDEYFRQRYEGRAGYRRAQPRGAAFSGGARWEYRPASGFVQLGYARSQDDVAPGYEIDFAGLRRGAETLVTDTVTLGFENVLTPRLRTRAELRVAGTSGREPRYGAEVSARDALGERWIVRADAGASDEWPTFRAHYGGAELEFAVTESLAIFVGAQLYRDTGEIENALLFTSAAPGLRSRPGELGVRHDGERLAWRVAIGTVEGDFAATNRNTDFFKNLYRDRHWLALRAAGPALAGFGVAGELADPVLTLFSGSQALLTNDNWGDAPNLPQLRAAATRVGAFAFAEGSRDAALLVTLPPGSYTVQAGGVADTTGVALVEIYEVP